VPLLFRIDAPPAGLEIGAAVRVFVPHGPLRSGVLVPAASVQRGPGGLPVVWAQLGDERFAPVPIAATPLSGDDVLVSGLEPGRRVVAQGAAFLAGVR
jgi:multidrug efflux pump subunit AcrA (membrane-fusion protein)